jgi:hypothetical protein
LTTTRQYSKLAPVKATFQIPDELYRRVKSETAREGRSVREVTIGLFERWLRERESRNVSTAAVDWRDFKSPLAQFVPKDVTDHSIDAIRTSIQKNWNESD